MKSKGTPNPNLRLALRSNALAGHGKIGLILAKVLRQLNRILFSCDISIGAQIDPSCSFYHAGLGCVIHASAVVGPGCTFFQHVTLGAAWHPGGGHDGAPHIGKNVMFGAGSVVLGDIEIGDDVTIGANTVVTKSIPAGCVVAGVPGKIIKRTSDQLHGDLGRSVDDFTAIAKGD